MLLAIHATPILVFCTVPQIFAPPDLVFMASLQAELAVAKSQLDKASAENQALRIQNEEVNTELAWVVKDLFRLKQQETANRCFAWLYEAEGLSSIRGLSEDDTCPVVQLPSAGQNPPRTPSMVGRSYFEFHASCIEEGAEVSII
jgi:hypothetical protein